MPLKYAVKTLDEVEEAHRPLYVEDKEVGFRLAVDGIDDPAELRRAKQREKEAREAAEKKLKEIEKSSAEAAEAARLAQEDAARKAGNVDALEKSWQQKHEKALADLRAEYEPRVTTLSSSIEKLLVDNVAAGIAREIALPGHDALLLPHLKGRLRAEVRDGQHTTVVVDADGKPSAMTVAELAKEMASNKVFAPVLVGSQGSGGGAGGQNKGGGAASAKQIKRSDFEALSPIEKASQMKSGITVID